MNAHRQRLGLTQSARLALNASLHSAISVLRSDAAGLTNYLEEQAAENPHLHLDRVGAQAGEWLPRWAGIVAHPGLGNSDLAEAAAPSLIAHVLGAINGMGLSARDQDIAYALAEALEPTGWLGAAPDEIAARLAEPLPAVEAVLARLQAIEPAGLFARDLAECLRLQAAAEGVLDDAMQAVLRHLPVLASGDFTRLARLSRISETRVAALFGLIRGMNPKPGTDFADLAAAAVREPDLVVRHGEQGWEVGLNRSALPLLRVVKAEGGSTAALAAAKGLQKMVDARGSTLLLVGREIVRRQAQALELGPIALLPMSMADLAQQLGLHESTISRVVAGTSLDGPRGTWWLRQMFSPALGGNGAPELSAASMRARLSRALGSEDPAKPLSDEALVDVLARETGVTLSRRTVTKYREALGIPPAHRRKRLRTRSKLPRSDRNGRTQG